MKRISPRYGNAGFTLIELVVTVGILGVFLVMTAVISRGAIDMNGNAKSRIASERGASAFAQQFRMDLEMRVERQEALPRIEKRAGDDRISLLTQRQGYPVGSNAADRGASLVSYRISDGKLERSASGYGFGGGGARPSAASGTLSLLDISADGPAEPATDTYQVISAGILRLELSFLVLKDGKSVIQASPPADRAGIQAIVTTIVTLDPDRRRPLDKAKLDSIAAEFPDAADYETPLEKWSEIAARLTTKQPSLPKSAASQVRVHQAIFPTAGSGALP